MPDLLTIPKTFRRNVGEGYILTPQELKAELGVAPDNCELLGEPAELPAGVRYQKVYYMRGTPPRSVSTNFRIKDPPTSGRSFAFVLGAEDARRLTLFCPFTFQSYQVPPDAGEIQQEQAAMTDLRLTHLIELITANWYRYVRLGFQRDYDVAALVLTKLGADVPTVSIADVPEFQEGEIVKEKKVRKGGKPSATELIKPVNRESKRGQVAEFFLGSEHKPIRECMARMGMTRNSVLSALYVLNKDHGLGYETINDTAAIDIPIDWDIWQ